jgi:hypothetical protein
LPRSRTTLLGKGLRPRIGVSLSKSQADDHDRPPPSIGGARSQVEE